MNGDHIMGEAPPFLSDIYDRGGTPSGDLSISSVCCHVDCHCYGTLQEVFDTLPHCQRFTKVPRLTAALPYCALIGWFCCTCNWKLRSDWLFSVTCLNATRWLADGEGFVSSYNIWWDLPKVFESNLVCLMLPVAWDTHCLLYTSPSPRD